MSQPIKPGFQAYLADGAEAFGAIREVTPHGIVVFVENAGDFLVSPQAVKAVHSGKVIFDLARIDSHLREAIGHAHDSERE